MENYMFQDMSKDFDIKKIRRSNTISESNCEPHVHPFHEIFYLSSGECTSFIDHNIYKFGKGDLFRVAVCIRQYIPGKEFMKGLLSVSGRRLRIGSKNRSERNILRTVWFRG